MNICTKCQEIYENNYDNSQFNGMCPKKHCCGDVVWIDESMVLPCKMLWDKGYDTMFTCEGHYEEWGVSPYIIFKVPIKAVIPDFNTAYYTSNSTDISDCIVAYYKNLSESSKCYNIDYNNAIMGEFKNEKNKEWWQNFGDLITKIFNSVYCQSIINDDTFDDLEIRILEYGFIKISLYFKPIVVLLAEMHPDEDCEVSELKNLHSEEELFLMHLDHKYKYLNSLIKYIDGLPEFQYTKD